MNCLAQVKLTRLPSRHETLPCWLKLWTCRVLAQGGVESMGQVEQRVVIQSLKQTHV